MKTALLLASCASALSIAFPARATSEVVAPPKAVVGFEVGPMALLYEGVIPLDHLAGGIDVFGGARLSKWFSVEGYAGVVIDSQTRSESYGACCAIDNWRWWWGRFGGRVWLHPIHKAHFELLLGAALGASIVAQHDTVQFCGPYPGTKTCYQNTPYPALDASVSVGFEIRAARDFGFRAIGTFGITGPFSPFVGASFGPVAHF